MAEQLPLITTPRPARRVRSTPAPVLAVVPDRPGELVEVAGVDWRLDEHTKQVGLAGIAEARRALAEAAARRAA